MTSPLPLAPRLTAARARTGVGFLFFAMTGCLVLACMLVIRGGQGGKPTGLDFDAFWAAGRFVAQGHPALAYDDTAMSLAERNATALPPGFIPFFYPPPFLLVCAPFGLLGYVAALFVFVAAQTGLLVTGLRRLAPSEWGWLPLLAFPGLLMNALSGQNAALSAACFGWAAVWLDERPVLAGFCLGALVYKPQLAIGVPFALLLGRRWRALFACGTGALSLTALSWLLFGTASWRGFLGHGLEIGGNLGRVAIIWPKLQTVFGAVMLLGGGVGLATAAQAVIGLCALAWLCLICRRRCGALLDSAALVTAATLITPHLLDYDLALLSVPMACLATLACRGVWHPGEKIVLAALFLLPLVARASGMLLGVTLGPPLILALAALIWRRAHAYPASCSAL